MGMNIVHKLLKTLGVKPPIQSTAPEAVADRQELTSAKRRADRLERIAVARTGATLSVIGDRDYE